MHHLPQGQPYWLALVQWRAGLRVAEAYALQWCDLNLAGELPAITTRQGKGGKPRIIPAHPELAAAFNAIRRGKPNDRISNVTTRTAQNWVGASITNARLSEVATSTSMQPPSCHSLRHSCARHWINSSLPVNTVSAQLGHATPQSPYAPT